MVRKTKRRRTTRRRSRRNMKQSNAPPRLSITSNTRRIKIPYAVEVATNSSRIDVTIASLFAHPPNTGFRFQYRESRINSVSVYWQSDNATSDAGSVCLNVEDFGENQGTDTCDFSELVTYPGSMVRKVWQNVSNRWFPTEPSDREFHQINGTDGLLTITVRHSISNSKLKGRLICSFNASLRGRSVDRKLIEAFLAQQKLNTIVSGMEMVEVQPASS